MYRKSEVPCVRFFTSAGYIVNKTSSSLDANRLLLVAYARVRAKLITRQLLSEKTSMLVTVFFTKI